MCQENENLNLGGNAVFTSEQLEEIRKLVDDRIRKETEKQTRSRFQAICDGIDAGLKENLYEI